jgi:hypothetical protein
VATDPCQAQDWTDSHQARFDSFIWRNGLNGFHATKTEMIGARIDLTLTAGANDVARTILFVAKKRATPLDAFFLIRFGRIER